MKEIAIVFYKEKGKMKTKEFILPKSCTYDHALTVDFIDKKMGVNNKWEFYSIK